MIIAAVVAYVLLAGLAVFQLALVAGAPLGSFAWGGQHDVLPRRLRIGSVVSILLYALFAWVIAGTVTLLSGPEEGRPTDVGIWVLTAYFGVGVVMNGVSRSRKERLVMTPVAAGLFVCCLILALA